MARVIRAKVDGANRMSRALFERRGRLGRSRSSENGCSKEDDLFVGGAKRSKMRLWHGSVSWPLRRRYVDVPGSRFEFHVKLGFVRVTGFGLWVGTIRSLDEPR